MIELIKGQTVSIDNHDRANGQPILFDYRIHIHKRMNRDKHSGMGHRTKRILRVGRKRRQTY